jgi:hypothetical protein
MAYRVGLTRSATGKGGLPNRLVTVVDVQWHALTVIDVISRSVVVFPEGEKDSAGEGSFP